MDMERAMTRFEMLREEAERLADPVDSGGSCWFFFPRTVSTKSGA